MSVSSDSGVTCVSFALCLNTGNKEDPCQTMRAVSSDNGNQNFGDLMDEFIQERLRARGTSVNHLSIFFFISHARMRVHTHTISELSE